MKPTTSCSNFASRHSDDMRPISACRHASPTVTLDVYAPLFNEREDRSSKAINDAVAALLSAC